MTTATTTSHDTGQQTSPRCLHREAQQPVTQPERNAAQRLGTPFPHHQARLHVSVRSKALAPEQRTTAARAFHADRELLSASKLVLDTWADTGPVGEPALGPLGNRNDVLGRSGSCFSQQSGRFHLNLARQLAQEDFRQLDLVAGVVHVDAHEPPFGVVIQNNALRNLTAVNARAVAQLDGQSVGIGVIVEFHDWNPRSGKALWIVNLSSSVTTRRYRPSGSGIAAHNRQRLVS